MVYLETRDRVANIQYKHNVRYRSMQDSQYLKATEEDTKTDSCIANAIPSEHFCENEMSAL